VRVVCATHRNVNELIQEGTFREDLYYRISEITLDLPAVRDRAGDALVIAQSLLKSLSKQLDRPGLSFCDDAISAIENYAWPGNVREMINKIKRSVIMADGKRITADDLQLPLSTDNTYNTYNTDASESQLNLRKVRESAERAAIVQALRTSNFNMAQASRLLGVTRPTLYNLTDKYRINTSAGATES